MFPAQSSSPVHLPSVEGLGVEGDGGRVAALDTVDGDLAAQLHPGHGEDGAGVGTGQREDVLLVVLQETEDPCRRKTHGEKTHQHKHRDNKTEKKKLLNQLRRVETADLLHTAALCPHESPDVGVINTV